MCVCVKEREREREREREERERERVRVGGGGWGWGGLVVAMTAFASTPALCAEGSVGCGFDSRFLFVFHGPFIVYQVNLPSVINRLTGTNHITITVLLHNRSDSDNVA